MWLPDSIYERVPQFWLLLGLLFMSSGTYLGFDYSLSFVYFGMGFICCLWSIWIFSMRLHARRAQKEERRKENARQAAERQESAEAENQAAEPAASADARA